MDFLNLRQCGEHKPMPLKMAQKQEGFAFNTEKRHAPNAQNLKLNLDKQRTFGTKILEPFRQEGEETPRPNHVNRSQSFALC